MEKKLIIHASELVTCKGNTPKYGSQMQDIGIIKNGAVYIEDGSIVETGDTESLFNKYCSQVSELIDAENCAVLPGFVDPHTHFIFGGYRAEEFSRRLRGDSYMSIREDGGGINATVLATRNASLEELKREGADRLKTMLEFGVTTVEGKSGYGLDMDTELRQLRAMKELDDEQPVEIVRTFLGAHDIPPEYKGNNKGFLEFLTDQVMPVVKAEKLAEFADIFTEKGVFSIEESEWYLTKAKEQGFGLKIHADEMNDLGGARLAAELECTSADHLLKANDKGSAALRDNNTVAVLLPATAFCLKEEYADGRKMIDAGCAVALGSDLNPGSCFTNSIPLLIALSCIYMHMTIEESITALTINAAAAIGRSDKIGSIEAGKQADIVILKYPSIYYIPYNTGVNTVKAVYKKGRRVI